VHLENARKFRRILFVCGIQVVSPSYASTQVNMNPRAPKRVDLQMGPKKLNGYFFLNGYNNTGEISFNYGLYSSK
jgi:hypothetical protein